MPISDVRHKDKYAGDRLMRLLLECDGNINCINAIWASYGAPALTLEEIGLVLGITRERVRQIEMTALRKLKRPDNARILRHYFL